MPRKLVCLLCLLLSPLAHVSAQTLLGEYRLDEQASELYWLVYSDGALARLGHNHVVAPGELRGSVLHREPLEASSVSLEMPVAALVVDDAALRARLGDEFASQPTADDIAGTRRNMLGDRLLNAEAHPVIRLEGQGPLGPVDAPVMRLQISLAGRTVTQDVPVQWRIDGASLQAEGSFRLTHEQLGLRPFSALMGALKVAQPLDFHYRLVARRVE